MKKSRINTKKQLEKYLANVVSTSIEYVLKESTEKEKDRQEQMSDDLKGLRASDAKEDVEEAEEEVVAVTAKTTADTETPEVPTEKQDVKTKLEKELTLTDLTDSLNLMRSGKSLKDEDVKTNIKQFFDGLSTAERQSMYVYINALAGIMTGTETGKEAADPADVGISTQEKPETETEKVTTSVTAVEKGTEEAPIMVGEVADKLHIYQKLQALMRR